jgi:ferrochelatase
LKPFIITEKETNRALTEFHGHKGKGVQEKISVTLNPGRNLSLPEPVGIILLNMGGPDSLQAVRPFLRNLFSDRDIIQLGPPFLQKPLAWLISTLRSGKTEKAYSLIGGKSPIVDITRNQANALQTALNSHELSQKDSSAGLSCQVFVGMRYWHPLIEEIVPQIRSSGIQKLIALSLYPHYSCTTAGSSLRKLEQETVNTDLDVFPISSWFDHPLYIDALATQIRKGIDSFQKDLSAGGKDPGSGIHLLFSAHSLPQKIIDGGDPYDRQIRETIAAVTKKLSVPWHLSYQSRSGPVKWLEPSTEKKLEQLSKDGVRHILVVPVSFVSDHIETLYEIDLLYRDMARSHGVDLRRVESLNTHPAFIAALRDIVLTGIRDAGWK